MRLIDADALECEAVCLWPPNYASGDSRCVPLAALKRAPTMEVVRCGECRHMEGNGMVCVCGLGHMGVVQPEYFCSYGERVTE